MRASRPTSLAILLTFGLSLFFILLLRRYLPQIDNLLIHLGWLGPLLAVIVYTLLAFTPVPTDPLTLILGGLYGPFWGLVISWAGNTAAALAEYFIAHHLSNLARFDTLKHKLPWGLADAPVASIWFLTLGRLVPGFGSKLVSVLSGLYHVPLNRYLWTTALMNLIGSVGFVFIGHFLTRS